jgi:ABC-type antimicrobial peptide transport system permease subunit
MKDFHYGKVDSKIDPVIFTYLTPNSGSNFVNVRMRTNDPVATLARIESIWKKVDNVHPLDAMFYDDAIQNAYSEFSGMIKMIGFLSFLAISIASLGLFGMVVYSTETRIKEIGIRKVLGATSGNLVLMLSRGFMLLLGISAAVALPAVYFLFNNVILTNFAFHEPIGMVELFVGALAVFVIAFIMIGSQTMKASRSNPAEVLKSE